MVGVVSGGMVGVEMVVVAEVVVEGRASTLQEMPVAARPNVSLPVPPT